MDKKERSGFVEIRDVLKNEVQRFSSINTVLLEGSSEFNKIDELYTNYGSELDISKNHIIKLKRREFFENLFIYIGLVFYFCCVAYVMLKRFPIHRIIFFIYYILESLLSVIIDVKHYFSVPENLYKNTSNPIYTNLMYNLTNATFKNITIADL